MLKRNPLIIVLAYALMAALVGAPFAIASMESLLPKEAPDGWALKSAPETFTGETLFEHIDGQAELFFQYGFEGSIFAVYRKGNSDKQKIDLDIYDMGNVGRAYGVFSRFRQENRPAGVGLDSYQEDSYVIFCKGRYFVMLQATEPDPAGLKQLAKSIESKIADSSPLPQEISFFPSKGLKAGSVEYYPEGLLGRDFLGRGFKATYLPRGSAEAKLEAPSESEEFSLFLAVFDGPQQALDAMKMYRDDLSKQEGGSASIASQAGSETITGKDPYLGKMLVIHKGHYLAGAAGFEKDKECENLLNELVGAIR
jgi:hypothetical protein